MRQLTRFKRLSSILRKSCSGAAVLLALVVNPSGAYALTFTTIDVPGATLTDASKINAAGQIVGGFTDASGTDHGFLLDNGTFTTIDVPGAVASVRMFLFDVSPRDLTTFVVVPCVLVAVALLACYLPTRRALREDPLTALKAQ